MIRPNWNSFNIKNRDNTKAFEDMCRVLFLRKYKKCSYDYDYNFNQAGLEFQPIYDSLNNEWCGAQCKYFSDEANSTKYAQMYKSLKKAFKYYKGKLDKIILYTNAQLEHICTEEEINSTKNSDRINIERDARKNGVTLVWMQADNIIDTLIEPGNIDLLKLYFSNTREIDFCNSCISTNDRTFLISNEYLNICVNDKININTLYTEIVKQKINLLLGVAGTGKTLAMKKLYLDFSISFSQKYFEKQETENEAYVPVFIKLKECINGNLESLVREHLRDYNMNYTDTTYQYIYLFDGLDEVVYYDLNKICNFISSIATSPQVKSIVISSRTDSNNLSYLYQEMSCTEYSINKLEKNHINRYFALKGDKIKIKLLDKLQNDDLLNDIDDIFSIDLLWNNIDRIDKNTSKIEIIELSIEHWIHYYSKYSRLSLFEPKQKYIIDICKSIAYQMQKQMSLTISLVIVQEIIINISKQQNPKEVNNIVDALTDLFFEKSNYGTSTVLLSYRHRRYQEYFLYLMIEEQFYTNPNILRELKLLPNKDFIIKIFLKTSLKRYESSKDIFKSLALRLFECYLGVSYLRNYTDEIIGRYYSFGVSEASYTYSKGFLYLLSTFVPRDLEILFENPNLSILDAINNENFAKFIEIYHRRNHEYIGKFIKEKCELNEIKTTSRDNYSVLYYLYNIKSIPIEELYNKNIKDVVVTEDQINHPDYIDSVNGLIDAFVKLSLEFDVEYLTEIIFKMSNCTLEILCFSLCKNKNINILCSKEKLYLDLRNELVMRIESKDEKYFVHTLIIYNMITEKELGIEELTSFFDDVNKRNYPSWSNNIEAHIHLAIVLKQQNRCALSEFKIGIEIINTVFLNYNSKDNILTEWIKIIKPFNYIYDEWLKYSHSHLLGELISYLNFDEEKLKSFIRELLKYDSVISMQCVIFTIFENNSNLFQEIVNVSLIEKVLHNSLKNSQEDSDSYSESLFQFAAMYSNIDTSRKFSLLISGIDSTMIRPNYRNEELASLIMPGCLYCAYMNYWYDEFELENKCKKLYTILNEINTITDNAGGMNCLKWIVNHCISDDFLKNELYDICETSLYEMKSTYEYNMDLVTLENLKDYYSCKIKEAPYSSLMFWKNLIEFEYTNDSQLSILYSVFDENYYPSSYGYDIVKYLHIPTAILLKQDNTREKITNYIIKSAGRYGIYNMIRTYSILGDAENGLRYTEYLFNFLDMLITKEQFLCDNNDVNLLIPSNYMNICSTTINDWIEKESICEMQLISNSNIKIVWNDFDEKEKFREDWATNFPDKSAYKYDYILYDQNNIIKEFSLVKVDGYRATLPMPKINTNLVKRDEYLLSRLFNSNLSEFHSYMIRANLQVE